MKSPWLILILLTFFTYSNCIAQSKTLVTFNSELEESVFNQLDNSVDFNLVELLSCLDPEVTETRDFEIRIDQIVSEIDVSKYSVAKRHKLIKLIYEKVHAEFLRKYKEQNYFSDISRYGNYNCVSATGLYAIVFNRLSIPYAIKEIPTHVFLVVYPNEDQIVIETTSPTFGHVEMDEDFKKEYIEYLVANKIVSESELRNSDVNELFNEYYFTENDISFMELVGIQYLNDAIHKTFDEEYKDAFNQLLKAQKFYESEKVDFLLLTIAYQWMASDDLSPEEKFRIVSFIWESNNETFADEFIFYEFNSALESILIEKGDYLKMDSIYNASLDLYSSSEVITKELKFIYSYQLGRLKYNLGKDKEALALMKIAVEQKPDHVDAKSLLSYALIRNYATERFNSDILDSLEHNFSVYPFLRENNRYRSFFIDYCLFGAYQHFFDLEQEEGMALLEKFEENYSDELRSNLNLKRIGGAYIDASKYYFRKRNMTELKRVLNKALEFDPENEEAKRRLEDYF